MSTALAEAAVRAIAPDASPVAIIGEGALAQAVRDVLGERSRGSGLPPVAVIETSGTQTGIEAALRGVADLGTVVLAGPPPVDPIPLDLYGDLHVRALTVVGVAEPGETRG